MREEMREEKGKKVRGTRKEQEGNKKGTREGNRQLRKHSVAIN